MASFYAELHVEGNSYRVVQCSYECHQATDSRGWVQAKVRHTPLELVLDVPEDDLLLAWAHAPHKPLAGEVVFYDVVAQTAHETIAFTAGECVQYAEQFASGATGNGAYVCQLTITAPSFELRAGGPAAPSQVPLAQVPQPLAQAVGEVAATEPLTALETAPYNPADPATHFVRPAALPAISSGLAAMLAHTLVVAPTAEPDGPPGFEAFVKADLQALYDTPTGRQLLESLHASGKRIYINYGQENGASFPYGDWPPAFYAPDGVTPGSGLAMRIEYNPFRENTGKNPWNQRPPGIGLAHELIHAEQAAYGRMRRGTVTNPPVPAVLEPVKAHLFELETVGVPPYDTYAFSENKIRAEWNPPQISRPRY